MALTRCGLPTDEVDIDAFRNLSAFSDVNITDILGTAVSNISEQALREIETTVKTIERSNQYERNNQEQDDQRDTSPLGRGDEDILSDSERGQGDRFDLYARSRNIRVPAEPDSNAGRERNRDLGRTQTEVSAKSEADTVYANAGQSQPDRSPDRDQRSSRSDDGKARSGDDGEGRREREAESGRLDGVGTQSELGTEQSGGNRVQQSDLRITQKPKRQRRTKKAEERTVFPVFSSSVGEQLSMFSAEKTKQDIANEYAMQILMKFGTGFVESKFRIAEYFAEGHTKQEKAKFLSDEYGWGGYTGGSESMDYRPGKGVTLVSHKENIDTDTPSGKFMLTVFAALSQLEREQLKQRQREGIEIAKAQGRYTGRKPIPTDWTRFGQLYGEWKSKNITGRDFMRRMDMSANTFYRRVREYELRHGITEQTSA